MAINSKRLLYTVCNPYIYTQRDIKKSARKYCNQHIIHKQVLLHVDNSSKLDGTGSSQCTDL